MRSFGWPNFQDDADRREPTQHKCSEEEAPHSKVTLITWMWLLFVYAIVNVFPDGSR